MGESSTAGPNGPVHLEPGEGVVVQNPVGGPITFKVRGEQTGGTLTVFESEVAPNEGPPLHVHANEDESWYVLDGDLRFRIGDEVRPSPPGSFIFVPRGIAHCFQNVGDRPAQVLVIFTPSGMERFFERFAALPAGSVGPDAFRVVGAEAGMAVVGPPLARSHPA